MLGVLSTLLHPAAMTCWRKVRKPWVSGTAAAVSAECPGEGVLSDRVVLSQHFHGPAHDLRQDDPAVAPRSHERRLGYGSAHFALREIVGQPGNALHHAPDGEGQVGPRVAVGHRVDVEIVDLLLASLQSCETA